MHLRGAQIVARTVDAPNAETKKSERTRSTNSFIDIVPLSFSQLEIRFKEFKDLHGSEILFKNDPLENCDILVVYRADKLRRDNYNRDSYFRRHYNLHLPMLPIMYAKFKLTCISTRYRCLKCRVKQRHR